MVRISLKKTYRVKAICANIHREFRHNHTCNCLLWRHPVLLCWGQYVLRAWPWYATRIARHLPRLYPVGKRARWMKLCFPGMSVHTLWTEETIEIRSRSLNYTSERNGWPTWAFVELIGLRDITFAKANTLANLGSWFGLGICLRQNRIQVSPLFVQMLTIKTLLTCKSFSCTLEKVLRA